MIKVIIFDLSNVCFTSEEPPFLKEYAQKHGLTYQELNDFYQGQLVKSEIGEITGQQVWQEIFTHFNLPKENPKKIAEEMIARFRREMPETLLLVQSIRRYQLAYLTNYNELYWKYVSKKYDLSEYFDYGLVSFQIKVRKPNKEGFQAILEHFYAKPEEAIFIDDSPENLVNAKEMGIKVIQFKDAKQLQDDLVKLGVEFSNL